MSVNAVTVKDENGAEVYAIKSVGSISFGRDKKVCHVTFNPTAARISRVHASIDWTDEGLFFVDKSKEGTLINGAKLKQAKHQLVEGVYDLNIGGVLMSVEVDGNELEETVLDSPESTINDAQEEDNEARTESPVVKEPKVMTKNKKDVPDVEVSDDEINNITTMTSFRPLAYKKDLKRKSTTSLFDESQPRGKRGPLVQKKLNFDEEMEKRGRKGPRVRKADDSVIIGGETPAKRSKSILENSSSLYSELKKSKSVSMEHDDEIESIVNQVAAIPSVSQESDQQDLSRNGDHTELHFDRGPAPPNETIKYANLIFQPPVFQKNNVTVFDHSVPNFKRFIPKSMRNDGRTSVVSMRSNMSYNTTIQMIDSRIYKEHSEH
uniref:FHA domain-containing protein n=1 Tax=Caenorhabditis tropicalis TaxID=1561998 RepID=A0A1I7U9W1_9PELO